MQRLKSKVNIRLTLHVTIKPLWLVHVSAKIAPACSMAQARYAKTMFCFGVMSSLGRQLLQAQARTDGLGPGPTALGRLTPTMHHKRLLAPPSKSTIPRHALRRWRWPLPTTPIPNGHCTLSTVAVVTTMAVMSDNDMQA